MVLLFVFCFFFKLGNTKHFYLLTAKSQLREKKGRFWIEKEPWEEIGSKWQVEGLPPRRGKTFPMRRMREKERMSVDVGEFIFTVGKVRSSAERKTNSGKVRSLKTVEDIRNRHWGSGRESRRAEMPHNDWAVMRAAGEWGYQEFIVAIITAFNLLCYNYSQASLHTYTWQAGAPTKCWSNEWTQFKWALQSKGLISSTNTVSSTKTIWQLSWVSCSLILLVLRNAEVENTLLYKFIICSICILGNACMH